MHDVWPETQMLEQGEGSAREESKTDVIVVVTVDRRTAEELRRFKQVSRRSCSIAVPEANQMNLATPLNPNVFNRATIQQRAIDLLVQWQDQLRVDIQVVQCFWQCT